MSVSYTHLDVYKRQVQGVLYFGKDAVIYRFAAIFLFNHIVFAVFYLDVGILRIFNVVITENIKSLELFRQSGIVIFGRTL